MFERTFRFYYISGRVRLLKLKWSLLLSKILRGKISLKSLHKLFVLVRKKRVNVLIWLVTRSIRLIANQ
jgi:hypothetical protein